MKAFDPQIVCLEEHRLPFSLVFCLGYIDYIDYIAMDARRVTKPSIIIRYPLRSPLTLSSKLLARGTDTARGL